MPKEQQPDGRPSDLPEKTDQPKVVSQNPLEFADDTPPNSVIETNAGIELLDRVRQHWPVWPAADQQLDNEPPDMHGDLQWGTSGSPPQRLGRFEIVRELGRGGFGVVLLARDPRLNEPVALKIPLAETLLSSEARDRMSREARAATILAHPAIVPVYETGEFASIPYIAYGYCEGESLSEWLAEHRGKVTPKLAAAIVAKLAEAMQHAHARGIIHRDLKPSNILLAGNRADIFEDQKSFVDSLRVADFGLAKVQAARSDVSRTGVPLGTPAYMSPEQSRGEIPNATSDLFSLGVILYELLTGRTPFRKQNDVATLRAIENLPHDPIPKRKSPQDLSAICDQCLEKNPTDRYSSAQALQDDLQRFLLGEPVQARPLGGMTRLVRWCGRNQALAASLATLFVVLCVATTFSTYMWSREKSSRSQAESHATRASVAATEAHEQAAAVREIVNRLLVQLTHVPSEDVQSLTPLLNGLLTSYHDQIRDQDSKDPVIQLNHISTLEHIASIHRNLGDNQRAADLFQEALDYVEKYRPEELGRQSYFLALISGELRAVGARDRAVEMARQGVQLQRLANAKGRGPHCSRNLLIAQLAALSEIIAESSPEAAAQHIDEAIELATEAIGEEPARWPPRRLWNCLLRDKVDTCVQLDDLEEAERFAEIAIRNIEVLLPDDRSYSLNQLAAVHRALTRLYLRRGNMADARSHCQEAVSFLEELLERHPQLGLLQTLQPHQANQMIEVELRSGQPEKARQLIANNADRIKRGREKFPKSFTEWDLAEEQLDKLRRSLDDQE